ncbi:Hpt domain-containing protein [Saccharospirillum alexandrii]|uniref:Hpt domain-containing protein n=1 Tax=Saccharospirillum alexandrii TaxID=2448477 RepID=UPI003736C66A
MSDSDTPTQIDDHLDVTILGELQALLEDDFPDLIDTFLSDARVRVRELVRTVDSGVAEDIRQSAHSFKGSTLNVGAKQLSSLCRELEDLARSGRTQGSKGLVDRIEVELNQVEKLMRDSYL